MSRGFVLPNAMVSKFVLLTCKHGKTIRFVVLMYVIMVSRNLLILFVKPFIWKRTLSDLFF